jgi:hypothetical protein
MFRVLKNLPAPKERFYIIEVNFGRGPTPTSFSYGRGIVG